MGPSRDKDHGLNVQDLAILKVNKYAAASKLRSTRAVGFMLDGINVYGVLNTFSDVGEPLKRSPCVLNTFEVMN
jgi:hypothetical protein